MKKLALFDIDGTLFDTSRVNYLSYKAAAEKLGYSIAQERFLAEYEGRNYKDFLPEFGIDKYEEMKFIHDEKKKIYPNFINEVRPNIFLIDIIKSLPDYYTKSIVTTASRKNAEDLLNEFAIADIFDFMITQEDVTKLKPNPEAYLLAMDKTGVPSKDTVIFEDSEIGIEAAYATGATVFQIRRFN